MRKENFSFKKAGSTEEGFTLIELMIVVVIIGILAAIAIPVFANQQRAATYAAAVSDVKNVANMAVVHKTKTGKYPQTCAEWKTVMPNGWKSGSSSAVASTVSPDGMNIWIEAQSNGSASPDGLNLAERSAYTPVYNSASGSGVMSRSEYWVKNSIPFADNPVLAGGYVNPGFMVSSLQTCTAWGPGPATYSTT